MSNEKQALSLLVDLIKYLRKRDIKKAKDLFYQLIEQNSDVNLTPEMILQIYDLGEVFRIFKEPLFFISEIDKALRKKSTKLLYLIKIEIMYNLYEDKKDILEDILKITDEALQIFPDYPEFLNDKSLILGDLGKKEPALHYINYALNFESENIMFLRNKAFLLYEMMRKQEALETIERALSIERNNPILNVDKGYIESDPFDDEKMRLDKMAEELTSVKSELKNVKIEFVTIAGLFIAILTLVSKIISFDYNAMKDKSYFEIILYQLSVNSAWLFAIFVILLFVLWFNLSMLKKK